MLVGRVRGIEAVAAVRIERQARHRRIERVAQDRPVIDVAVVGRNAARDRAVFKPAVDVRNRHRRVVRPGQRDRQRAIGRIGDGA